MSGDNYELVQCYKTTLPQQMMMLIYEFLVGVDYQKWHSFAFFPDMVLSWLLFSPLTAAEELLEVSCWATDPHTEELEINLYSRDP